MGRVAYLHVQLVLPLSVLGKDTQVLDTGFQSSRRCVDDKLPSHRKALQSSDRCLLPSPFEPPGSGVLGGKLHGLRAGLVRHCWRRGGDDHAHQRRRSTRRAALRVRTARAPMPRPLLQRRMR